MLKSATETIEVNKEAKKLLMPSWVLPEQWTVAPRKDRLSAITVEVCPHLTLVLMRMVSGQNRGNVLVALNRGRVISPEKVAVTIWLPRSRLNEIKVVNLKRP